MCFRPERRLFEVNVFALLHMTQACLPKIRQQRSSTIIDISSIAGKFTFPGNGPYAASKHAVEAFTDVFKTIPTVNPLIRTIARIRSTGISHTKEEGYEGGESIAAFIRQPERQRLCRHDHTGTCCTNGRVVS